MKRNQADLAREFLELHKGPRILVLPNAWDVSSARVFEDAGFPAIGTSSAGVAFAHVPVTADVEAGFGSTPEQVADTAREVIAAGAVGMNLEDGAEGKPEFLADVSRQKEIIGAILEVAKGAVVPFVLNARTDIFLYGIGPAETRLARTIERLNAYRAAGAPSLFAPGVKNKETISQLARGISGPLNILATVGTPPVAELQKLGVARVSVGSGPMRAALGFLGRMARQLRNDGVFTLMTEGAPSYEDVTRLIAQEPKRS
jgi:2-methylisocitrate lyase-like PEP mutase family enzyme